MKSNTPIHYLKIPINSDDSIHQKPQQLYPQNLSTAEMANPHLVIHSFFREYDLPGARKYISGWMNAVYSKTRWIKKNPANLLHFTERLFRLIEAGWLIDQMDNSKRSANLLLQYNTEKIELMNPRLYCKSIHKENPWDYFPRSLSQKNYINPYKVFSKFFRFHTLHQWKTELHTILHLALSDHGIEHSGESINILECKKGLDRLVDACHLIDVREFERSNGQLFLKVCESAAGHG